MTDIELRLLLDDEAGVEYVTNYQGNLIGYTVTPEAFKRIIIKVMNVTAVDETDLSGGI